MQSIMAPFQGTAYQGGMPQQLSQRGAPQQQMSQSAIQSQLSQMAPPSSLRPAFTMTPRTLSPQEEASMRAQLAHLEQSGGAYQAQRVSPSFGSGQDPAAALYGRMTSEATQLRGMIDQLHKKTGVPQQQIDMSRPLTPQQQVMLLRQYPDGRPQQGGMSPFGQQMPQQQFGGMSPFGQQMPQQQFGGMSPFGQQMPQQQQFGGMSPFGQQTPSQLQQQMLSQVNQMRAAGNNASMGYDPRSERPQIQLQQTQNMTPQMLQRQQQVQQMMQQQQMGMSPYGQQMPQQQFGGMSPFGQRPPPPQQGGMSPYGQQMGMSPFEQQMAQMMRQMNMPPPNFGQQMPQQMGMRGQMGFAGGGLAYSDQMPTYAAGGKLLSGPGDGMSDSIPAVINGTQRAALADGEFVMPADVVAHLGNGSTSAGANRLYDMMDRVRKARTGSTTQPPAVNMGRLMPA
jgi:hypothetical protein